MLHVYYCLMWFSAAYRRPIVSRPRLLIYGDVDLGHSSHLTPAVLHCMERLPIHLLDIPTLYSNSAKTPEEACSQVNASIPYQLTTVNLSVAGGNKCCLSHHDVCLYSVLSYICVPSLLQVFREARRSTPSAIYIPHIDRWWQVLSDTMQATFLMLLSDIDPLMPILLIATSDRPVHSLQSEVRKPRVTCISSQSV